MQSFIRITNLVNLSKSQEWLGQLNWCLMVTKVQVNSIQMSLWKCNIQSQSNTEQATQIDTSKLVMRKLFQGQYI